MKARAIGAIALSLMSVAFVEGQTFSEQLQRAIYTQAALGDVDAAIKLYQQVIASAPAGSDVKTQAERLLAAAEAYRREGRPAALGTFDGRTYKHVRTGIAFAVPAGWSVRSTLPSSDNGEQMWMDLGEPNAEASVWMLSEELDNETINQRLYSAPLVKMRQRGQSGYLSFPNWLLREGTTQRMFVGGHQAVAAMADYKDTGRAMVESMVWVFSNKNRAFFSIRVPAEALDRVRPQFDAWVTSAKIP